LEWKYERRQKPSLFISIESPDESVGAKSKLHFSIDMCISGDAVDGNRIRPLPEHGDAPILVFALERLKLRLAPAPDEHGLPSFDESGDAERLPSHFSVSELPE
jgi:hypothetical protein